MAKYRERPPVVEAVKFDGSNTDEVKGMFAKDEDDQSVVASLDNATLLVQSDHYSLQMVPKGAWCVKRCWGVDVMNDEEFTAKYEKDE